MHEETILTWNFTNWVTIVLMAAVGFAIVRLAATMLAKQQAAS